MTWVPEGDPELIYRAQDLTRTGRVRGGKDNVKPLASVQYLRGASSGALDVTILGMRPGSTVRLLPEDGFSARARRDHLVKALDHLSRTTAITRLNSDDRAMWLIGFLWAKGMRAVELHVDLGHRV